MEEKKKIVKVKVKKIDDQKEPTTPVSPSSQSNNQTISPNTDGSSFDNKNRLLLIGGVVLVFALLIALLFSHSNQPAEDSTTITESSSTLTTISSSSSTTTTTTVPAISDTEYYYNKVCDLDIYDLEERESSLTGTTSYYYKGLPIQSEDEEWLTTSWNKDKTLNQGAIYRSMAGVLEGFSMKINNGSSYSDLLCGETWTSRDSFEPYATNAATFISKDDSSKKLLSKIESLSCVQGTFDYNNNNYHFVIEDVAKCAQEMKITEEMLGYCFGVFSEYGANIVFNGNTCTVDRQL